MKGNDGIAISGANRQTLRRSSIERRRDRGGSLCRKLLPVIARPRNATKAAPAVASTFAVAITTSIKPDRTVGMREPARLPDRGFGVMRENLYATFRHLAGLDARYGELGCIRSRLGVDRPLHMRDRTHAKAGRFKPAMRGGRIAHRERREMNAGIARHRADRVRGRARYPRSCRALRYSRPRTCS